MTDFESAWYEIAYLLGIGAQNMSPKDVHEKQVMPRLRALRELEALCPQCGGTPDSEFTMPPLQASAPDLGNMGKAGASVPTETITVSAHWTVEDYKNSAVEIRHNEGLVFGDDWADQMDQAAQVHAALERSADTFTDCGITLRILNRELLAKVCEIAEQDARTAIAASQKDKTA